ncbi:rhomboid family intramembrane serine protease [Maritalea porphyrae]|uniref:rhomboid family intramembrane serine protease n=1 Tax=Maritalea porphyrae TaxID=880732 RepID=UPI0022AE8160|nr:rhomboid family intramembrane serine protease [Maritalea porphyrae]MCZ4272786.1 rhomboid family intramembrane serine protease [Maritalea porphyrae]
MNLPPGHGDTPNPNANPPAFNLPFIVAAAIGLLFSIHLAAQLMLTPEAYDHFFVQFGYVTLRDQLPAEFRGGEFARYYTLFSHAFLHVGWQHLIFNLAWLAVFGSPVARRYGNIGFIAVFLFGSAVGALAFGAISGSSFVILIGASGAVSAFIGGATRFVFQPVEMYTDEATGEVHVLGRKLASLTDIVKNRRALSFAGFWLALNILFGLVPGIVGISGSVAWQAHLGGYVAGYFMVAWLERRPF